MSDIMQVVRDLSVAKAQVVLSEFRDSNPSKKDTLEETEIFIRAYFEAFEDLNANLLKFTPKN